MKRTNNCRKRIFKSFHLKRRFSTRDRVLLNRAFRGQRGGLLFGTVRSIDIAMFRLFGTTASGDSENSTGGSRPMPVSQKKGARRGDSDSKNREIPDERGGFFHLAPKDVPGGEMPEHTRTTNEASSAPL